MSLIPIKNVTDVARGKVTRYHTLLLLLSLVFVFLSTLAVARKDVTLVIDGEAQKLVTYHRNVGALLADVGIVVGPHDYVAPAPDERLEQGVEIVLTRAFPVTVMADGRSFEVQVAQATVNDVLEKLGLFLGELDRVDPLPQKFITRGDTVQVIRVEERLFTQRIEIPYRELRRSTMLLDRGLTRIAQKGVVGLREDTVEQTLENGVEVATQIVQSDMMYVKQDQIVEYGENTVLSRGGRAVSFSQVVNVSATAYCAGTAASGCPMNGEGHSVCTGSNNDGRTATGRSAVAGDGSETHPHIVAVDPRMFPLGSKLYIDGYGYAIAADTGGAIKQNRIDLLMSTHQAALQFGRRNVRVYRLID
ncbi:MAG: 3D domain-containing protein [Firmicutes bacterium]|nr:3D domain-containing protein [Bacillota bacterium]